MSEFDIKKMAKNVAESALDSILYQGKSIREWMQIIGEADYVGKWIPVSERLPEEETDVLICNSKGQIEVSCGSTFDDGTWEWYTSGWHFGEIIAWMPLPEPYKEGMSE